MCAPAIREHTIYISSLPKTTVVPLLPPASRYIYIRGPQNSHLSCSLPSTRGAQRIFASPQRRRRTLFPAGSGSVYIYMYSPAAYPVGGRDARGQGGVYTSVLARAPYNIYNIYICMCMPRQKLMEKNVFR